MTKKEFESLSQRQKLDAVRNALCYVVVYEDCFPLNLLDNREEVTVIKIVLGKYMNQECNIQ